VTRGDLTPAPETPEPVTLGPGPLATPVAEAVRLAATAGFRGLIRVLRRLTAVELLVLPRSRRVTHGSSSGRHGDYAE
jgi:hypothetical protein